MSSDPTVTQRIDALARAHFSGIAVRTDRLFAGLLALQWIAAIATALVLSPRSWSGGESHVHPHVWTAIFFGALVALPSAGIALRCSGSTLSRHVVAVAQMLMGALLIHVSGGRIETHFHVFGSLAFLAFYRDWRVLVTGSLVVAADHLLRGAFWPESVYGVATASMLRALEHAWWLVFEDVFLVYSCVQGQKEIREVAERHALLEKNRDVEAAERDRATATSSAKSSFLANMSHEIRTPMTAILGFADLLLEPDLSASDRVGHVQIIRKNGKHLLALIDDILDLTKIEAGKMTVDATSVAPHRVLGDVAALMRPRAEQKNIALEVRYDGGVPARIETDQMRFRQILMNLVSNAIKFTERGKVQIVARAPGGDALEVSVIDSGIGIDDAAMPRILEPFTQADGSITRRFGGTGLGVAISTRLARMLGGELGVTSTVGVGSTFTVRIATGSLAGVPLLDEYKECGPSVNSGTPDLPAVRGARVLVVEDGPDNQLLIGMYLRKAGAAVELVENGRLGVDAAMRAMDGGAPFDVILMDMQMPVLDGYSAATELRARGYRGPIIALTAHAMSGERERCIDAGCDDYLTKPISRIDLVHAVEQRAKRTSSGRTPAAVSGELPVEELVSEFGEDEEMSEIVDAFVRNMPARASDIGRALENADWDELARLAHHLKGAAGGYGFPRIGAAAADTEHAAKRGDKKAAAASASKLVDMCLRARARAHAKAA